jgi:mannosylglycerate hydrolase
MDHLYFVVHTHWDREWYQPFQQMRARLVAMADRMLPMVESGRLPHFHFDGQTIVLDDYLEIRPGNQRRLAALVKAGKIAIGPWYVLADSFLVSGESLIRNLEIGAAIAHRFGRPLDVGYLPDQFGHIAQLPQILAGFGFKTAVLWRGVPPAVNRNRFLWEAPDGTRIFTVYLPFGYSNGANLPLDSADALFRRAQELAALGREFTDGAPILVMNGTDHAEPDPRLMERIAEVNGRDGMSIEVGRLEDYIKRLSETPLEGVPVHRGELRSPSRAHLLPSVTSARTWIKQRDFENCALLERYADPLAAMANAMGAGDGMLDFLDLAWRTEIQNHPHDSICGCSVDQVHADMRFRFDQAALIAENVVRAASHAILQRERTGEPILAVFNPSFATEAVAVGEVELDDPSARWVAVDGDGRRLRLAVDITRGERAFEVELPAAEFKSIVAELSTPQILGRTVNRYEIKRAGDGRVELNLSLSRAAISDVDLARFRDEVRNTIPDTGTIRVRATNAARCGVSFFANGLAQAGFSFFRLVRDDSPEPAASASAAAIDNEFYRVEAAAAGLHIRDIASGETLEIYFEDDGDRGDEYNYDPVPGSAAISTPTQAPIEAVEGGPVRKRLKLRLKFAVPEALAEDRATRSSKTCELSVSLTATLYHGLARVDFVAEVDNPARDHRLRAALRTPVPASEAVSDTAFAVLRRPLTPSEPRGTEEVYPTVPHRMVTAVEGEALSAALMSRGLYEIEARLDAGGTTLLLTLLRCVGWLSRSDLAMRNGGAGPEVETPGAQEPGTHRFEFAITTYRGGYLEAALMQRAAAYAFPPRILSARESASAAGGMQLIRCANPNVLFSTARADERDGYYIVRGYSVSPQIERAEFSFGEGRSARLVDLARRPLKREGMRRRKHGLEMNLHPFEIVTFRVGGGKNFHSEQTKSLIE